MKLFRRERASRSQRGEAIVESMICMLLLCLVLFGLLQMFYISAAQMLTDYAAFSAARASTVGFADYLVHRKARTATIGASGKLIEPAYSYNSLMDQAGSEYFLMAEYHSGEMWLEYEYWEGGGDYPDATLGVGVSSSPNVNTATATFNNYPFFFPMHEAFTTSDEIDIRGTARTLNSSDNFLE